jgi:glucosamine-6-phosphate deaminase
MRIVIAKNYEDMSIRAARIVASQLYLKPNSVLGLATGSTPMQM